MKDILFLQSLVTIYNACYYKPVLLLSGSQVIGAGSQWPSFPRNKNTTATPNVEL